MQSLSSSRSSRSSPDSSHEGPFDASAISSALNRESSINSNDGIGESSMGSSFASTLGFLSSPSTLASLSSNAASSTSSSSSATDPYDYYKRPLSEQFRNLNLSRDEVMKEASIALNHFQAKLAEEQENQIYLTPTNFRYESVDVYSYDRMDTYIDSLAATKAELFNEQRSYWERFLRILQMNATWSFLFLLGIICSLVALLINFAIDVLLDARAKLTSHDIGFFPNYLIWIACTVFMSLMSALVITDMSPAAGGAGVAEMKSILSGLLLHQYLTLKCLLAKVISIIFAFAAGLTVGKEGPLIHICSILAYQLTKLPIFGTFRQNKGLKIQMLAAGCAVGPAVNFGAPVGGVLFSLETTSTFYLIQNLWKAFFCAISAALFVKILNRHQEISLFSTNFVGNPYTNFELISFSLLGLFFGLAGAAFVKMVQFTIRMRKTYKVLAESKYQVLIVAFFTGLLTFPLKPLREGQMSVIQSMFSTRPLDDWMFPSVFINLALFILFMFFLTGITVGLPIACGVYTPVFALGAASGRLIGEILAILYPDAGITPAGYAVVGAAAFSAGVTRTLSSAIICFEATGQLTHLLPVFLSVLISSPVASFFTPSVYDVFLEEKGLPYMPVNCPKKLQMITAAQLMRPRPEIFCVTPTITRAELSNILLISNYNSYPLVDHQRNSMLIGQLSRDFLQTKLREVPQRDPDPRKDTLTIYDDSFGGEMMGFDPCPFVVDATSIVGKIQFKFSVLGLSHAWVVRRGELFGVLTKKDLMAKILSNEL